MRDAFLASCVAAGFTSEARWEAAEPLAALRLVASGLGAAMIQKSMLRGATEGVVVRELPWYTPSTQLWAAWHRVDLRPLVAEFRQTLLAGG
ncbi:LysR substrate-binding domain-containing protein [Streptomyces sp. 21So2-11]|uniref:LysR substrate-binding domain-containing protein n=1 Tax=Streptomyces sp. 21So2-11 TaxID=3144408 RepID=UPI00321B81C5